MYSPKLSNGTEVKLPWQTIFLKLHCCWPLREDISKIFVFVYNSCSFVVLVAFVLTLSAECAFIIEHTSNISLATECLCTTIVGFQLLCRISHLQSRRKTLRKMIEKFATKIYQTREENEEQYTREKHDTQLINLYSVSYILALILFLMSPIAELIAHPDSNALPYRMIFFLYDVSNPILYYVTLIYTCWIGVVVVLGSISEDALFWIMLSQATGRLHEIEKDLSAVYRRIRIDQVITDNHNSKTIKRITDALNQIYAKQQVVISFIDDVQNFFSPMLFFFFLMNVALLCVIAFQLATLGFNLGTMKYMFWLVSSILELYILCSTGQNLTTMSEKTASNFYSVNWQDFIFMEKDHGSNNSNVDFLKDLAFAIFRSQKSLKLTALKILPLNLNTFEQTLKTSMSYFMFLNAIK